MSDLPYPQSISSEQALLGGLLQDPEQFEAVAEWVGDDDFYRPEHAELFNLLQSKRRSGDVIDLVTIPVFVGESSNDQKYGGLGYVLDLPQMCPSTTNLLHYAKTIAVKSSDRQAIRAMEAEIERRKMGDRDSANEVIATLQMGQDRTSKASKIKTKREVAEDAAHVLQVGVAGSFVTELVALDAMYRVYLPGDWTLLGGTPGAGKSVLMSTIAHRLEEQGLCIGECHLEMDSIGLGLREIAARAGIDMGVVMDVVSTDRELTADDWDRIHEAIENCSDRAYFESMAMATMGDVEASLMRMDRRARHEHGQGLSAFFIDFAQVITHNEETSSAANILIGYGVKVIAKRLGAHGFLSTQLNRKGETAAKAGEPLTQEHIYGGGGLGMAAANIGLIDRDRLLTPREAVVHGPKARYGVPGKAHLEFDGPHQRFRDPRNVGAVDLNDIDNAAGAAIAASLGLDDLNTEHPTWEGVRQ